MILLVSVLLNFDFEDFAFDFEVFGFDVEVFGFDVEVFGFDVEVFGFDFDFVGLRGITFVFSKSWEIFSRSICVCRPNTLRCPNLFRLLRYGMARM